MYVHTYTCKHIHVKRVHATTHMHGGVHVHACTQEIAPKPALNTGIALLQEGYPNEWSCCTSP